METVSECNYDSDDSLPDIEELCSSRSTEIKEGDIVWAKHKNLYWPSLIRKVLKKERKVSLWYLDLPKKCFKVPLKNIHSFYDRSFSQEVQKAVSDTPFKTLHEKVLTSTQCYLQRKGEGIKDDPGSYFDRSVPYLSLYNSKSSMHKSNDQFAHEYLQTILKECNKDNSEQESISESEDEEEKFEKLRGELELEEEEYCPEEKVDAIVACITAGKCNKYLLDVKAHKIPSERQEVFDESKKTGNIKPLLHSTSGVLIKDFSKIQRIYDYLQNFYDNVAGNKEPNKFRYVTSVWLPDALTKALSLIDGASEDTSESLGAKQKFSSVEKKVPDDIEDTNKLINLKSMNKSNKKRKLDSQKKKHRSPRKHSNNAVLIENCVKSVEKSSSIKEMKNLNNPKSKRESSKKRILDIPEKKEHTSPKKHIRKFCCYACQEIECLKIKGESLKKRILDNLEKKEQKSPRKCSSDTVLVENRITPVKQSSNIEKIHNLNSPKPKSESPKKRILDSLEKKKRTSTRKHIRKFCCCACQEIEFQRITSESPEKKKRSISRKRSSDTVLIENFATPVEKSSSIEDITNLNSPISKNKRKLDSQEKKPRKQCSDNAVLIENCVKSVEKSSSIKKIKNLNSPEKRILDNPEEKKRTSSRKVSRKFCCYACQEFEYQRKKECK